MGGGSGSGGAMLPRSPLTISATTENDDASVHLPLPKRYPPVGLKNWGNTCYANAALQCLLSTALARALVEPRIIRVFKRYSSNAHLLDCQIHNSLTSTECHSVASNGSTHHPLNRCGSSSSKSSFPLRKPCCHRHMQSSSHQNREKHTRSETCRWLTAELTTLCKQYTADPSASTSTNGFFSLWGAFDATDIDPGNITRHVTKLSNCLRIGRQEDAHEFLRALLGTLVMDGHNRQLSSLFDGLLESAVTCQTCGHCSITRDRYMDLSLEISPSNIRSLRDALKMFTKTERLSEDNLVDCERCDERRVVSKGLRLATAPTILVCHLKRFAYDEYGRMVRLSKAVQFPLKLMIGEFMSRANLGRPPPYELVGVLVHQGQSCSSGHYLAYVKSGGEWYRASDSHIMKVDVDTVLAQKAYILMYEVEGMRNHKIRRNATKQQQKEAGRSFEDSVMTGSSTANNNSMSQSERIDGNKSEGNAAAKRHNSYPLEATEQKSLHCTLSQLVSIFPLCAGVEICLGDDSSAKNNNEAQQCYVNSQVITDDDVMENMAFSDSASWNKINPQTQLETRTTDRNHTVAKTTDNKENKYPDDDRGDREATTTTTTTPSSDDTQPQQRKLTRSSSSGNLRERMEDAAAAHRKRTPSRETITSSTRITTSYGGGGGGGGRSKDRRRAKSLTRIRRGLRELSPVRTSKHKGRERKKSLSMLSSKATRGSSRPKLKGRQKNSHLPPLPADQRV